MSESDPAPIDEVFRHVSGLGQTLLTGGARLADQRAIRQERELRRRGDLEAQSAARAAADLAALRSTPDQQRRRQQQAVEDTSDVVADTADVTSRISDVVESLSQKHPDQWLTGGEPITRRQAWTLGRLAERTGEEIPEGLTKAQASILIGTLTGEEGAAARTERLADVAYPAGVGQQPVGAVVPGAPAGRLAGPARSRTVSGPGL
jgi:hypothetical protein